MGNRVAVSVPSQILPIEFYLKELADIHVKTSLGNTCFLKVACCSSPEGSVVVKVFVNNENAVRLEPYRALLLRVHDHLDNAAPNCLMYAAVRITDTAGVMLRQHVDRSLHERISTRPFLTHLEKTWLTFQLLCALRQAHQAQVYHGDIKSENVLVTASGWLQLTDFAPYKPVTLPDNDPSDFTYFFDTSRRRTCYIAPERFRSSDGEGGARESSPEGEAGEKEPSPTHHQPPAPHTLTPAMDIFSAGCVLVELFTEGYVPFDLTQLLAYRKDQYHPRRLVDKIQDPHIQALVLSMLSREPCQRRSAGDYLEEQRGLAFPDYFYSFLWPYCKHFAAHPKRPPDVTVRQLSDNLNDILLNMCGEHVAELDRRYLARCSSRPPPASARPSPACPAYRLSPACLRRDDDDGGVLTERCQSLILVLPMVTAAFRSAVLCSSKLLGLQSLLRLARFCPDLLILDRLLPTLLVGLESSESGVRACAVDCITQSLGLVSSVPRRDANIFPEYIVPSLARLVQDPCALVRQALAENVSTIAHTAQRFLDWSLHNGYFTSREYDVELQNLCDSLQQVVTLLIMDPSNAVKRTFMHSTQGHLWTFFGLARANDLIMTHLITYLNDNQDYQLRRDFFECLRSNALMIGPYQGDIILPLLMQCMNDSEEWVVVSSIGALIAMCKEDIFSNAQLLTVLSVTLPLLLHPNAIIRQSIVHLVCGVCELLDPVDVLASVRPLVAPYLTQGGLAIDYTSEVCVLSALTSCIPRRLWRTLLSFVDLRAALDKMRAGLDHPRLGLVKFLEASMPSGSVADDKTMRRVMALGLDDAMASAVLCLEQHLLGVHNHKRATLQGGGAAADGGSTDDRGEIQVLSAEVCGGYGPPEIVRVSLHGPSPTTAAGARGGSSGHGGGGGLASPPHDWALGYHTSRDATPSSGGTGPSSGTPAAPNGDAGGSPHPAAAGGASSAAVPSASEAALRQVVMERHRQHQLLRRQPAPAVTASQPGTPSWQPAGALVSHLHEHTARVHRLCAVEGTSLYASASHDGTVRVWDAARTDRDTPVNRSRGVYGRLGSAVRALAACPSHHSVAAASDNGSVHVFRLDKLSMLCDRALDKEEDVYAVDMAFYDTGRGDSVVAYATVTGGVVGWDLRQPGTAWRFCNAPKNGLITSLMVDPDSNFLAVGTNKGAVTCWDIRFQLPITQIRHENGHHIRRLARNPCDSRTAFAAVTGNNEVGLWELDTNYRRQTLWASPKEPLKHKEVSSKNINGVCVGALGAGGGACDVFVVTGGSDCCLRYWNLAQPRASRVIAHAAIDHPAYPDTSYREVRAELGGNTVIVEDRQAGGHRKDPLGGSASPWLMPSNNPADLYDPHRPASGHRDTITDVILVESPQRLVVSADAMGVVKIWK